MVKRVIYSLLVILLVSLLAFGIIAYGRGFRFNLDKKSLSQTGILSASSYPEKASVWVNDKLISATNSSVSLRPDWYDIRITKEGYQSWQKNIRIQPEIVSQIDALLIPTNPSLRTLTFTGVLNPVLSPSDSKVAYIVPDQNSTGSAALSNKSGVFVLEFRNAPLGGKNEPRAVFQPITSYNWENSRLFWSYDEKEIMLTFYGKNDQEETEEENVTTALLLNTDNNSPPTNITPSYRTFLSIWQEKTLKNKDSQQNSLLDSSISDLLTRSSDEIQFSPDETKTLYLATSSATLSQIITPPLIGNNPTEETRKITPDKYYIYDIKEDKNYFISDKDALAPDSKLYWYSDSKHIIMVENDTIYIIDHDGTNKRTVYTGPFEKNVVYPWSSGNRLVILTRLNQSNVLPNFYEVDLR